MKVKWQPDGFQVAMPEIFMAELERMFTAFVTERETQMATATEVASTIILCEFLSLALVKLSAQLLLCDVSQDGGQRLS